MNKPTASPHVVIPFDYQSTPYSKSNNTIPDHKDPDALPPSKKPRGAWSTRFASALAHEVRNPLTNINLSIDMLNSAITDMELVDDRLLGAENNLSLATALGSDCGNFADAMHVGANGRPKVRSLLWQYLGLTGH